MRFDQLLREAIDEMTDEIKPPSPAYIDAAMARGRRIRRRRQLTAAGGALVACAAVVAPWTVLSRPDAPAPTAAMASATFVVDPDRTGLAGGWVITGAGNRVLDRANRTYRRVESKGRVLPAPVGDRVLIDQQTDELTVTNVRGAEPVTVEVDGLGGDYQWSPAGDRLVGTVSEKEPARIGFVVIDGRTGAVTKHWIDQSSYDCSQCSFKWTRDGREVVMAIADRSGGEGAEFVGGLQLFDATTGAPTRSLPIRAMPSGPFSWSPNGRFLIANPNLLEQRWQIIEVSTGQGRPFPYDAVWVSDDQLLATYDREVLTLRPDGTIVSKMKVEIPDADDPISLGPPA